MKNYLVVYLKNGEPQSEVLQANNKIEILSFNQFQNQVDFCFLDIKELSNELINKYFRNAIELTRELFDSI